MPHKLTLGRLVLLARRDWTRGWRAVYHDYWTARKVLRWRPAAADKPPEKVSVHVLTGEYDWRYAAWMLASWFHFTERNWPVFIHDDGSLPPEAVFLYATILPEATVITRARSDAEVDAALEGRPLCIKGRHFYNPSLKFFDTRHYAPHDRLIILDSDVLFFQRPSLLLDWVDGRSGGFMFMHDVADASALDKETVRRTLGMDLMECVNSGMCFLPKSLIDLDFTERCLAETELLQTTRWTFEQTLFALCASRNADGRLLPKTYELTLNPAMRPDSVARHYVGRVRQLIYSEGIRRLRRDLLQ
ncbi:MAG: hypothetical protein JJU00_04110 [Opitutales bacterium]|nr:hypothetical protein [Opitutales bacterium]